MPKVTMPDGQGGFKEVDAKKISDGARADDQKQGEKLQEESVKAQEERVGAAAEAFNKFHLAYATDHNLSEEDVVKAAYLELLNLKEYYPQELGGSTRVEELCKEMWAWFEKNKEPA